MIDHKSLFLCCSTVALSSFSFTVLAADSASVPLSVLDARCYVKPPAPLDTPPTDNNKQIAVRSQRASAKRGESAEFEQQVAAAQGNRRLHSDKAVFNQKDQVFTAEGHVKYQDQIMNVQSHRIQANLKSDATTIDGANYQFNGQAGRGQASNLHMNADHSMSMKHASYTACPPGDESWRISASKIDIDKNHDWAVAHNAIFRVHEVPVLYLPYFSYPISDKRQTGFLYPSVGSSSNKGLDISTPFYWNIAPNYDLTLTPRYMAKRGQKLSGSFRYLVFGQEGELDYEDLENDQLTNERRYLFHWQDTGAIGDHWRMKGDYTQVSDPNYFSDVGSLYGHDADQLIQHGEVNYEDQHWNAGIMANDYQILGNTEDPHKVLPELHFDGRWDTGLSTLQFAMKSQLVRFTHKDPSEYVGQRYHFEPSLILPLRVPGGFITSQVSLMQTYYNQDTKGYTQLSDHINRTLPKYRVLAGLNFDRELTLFGDDYLQTVEPRVQYLYIPYKKQDDIGIYDTTALEQDYFGMFRDNRYGGLDRIANTSQITAGATTRFLNAQNEEKLRLSVAQIFYFKKNQVSLNNSYDDNEFVDQSRSALAVEGDVNISHDWFFHSGLQVSSSDNQLNKANAALEWKPEENKLAQLNYRYGEPNGTLHDKINQIGMKMSWPLLPAVHVVGSYYRDLYLSRSIESLLGFQYDSCCWAFQLSFQRSISRHYDRSGDIESDGQVDNSINFQFLLKGIGATDNTANYRKMMDAGRFPYGHPFYLND
ncbi:LPS assembly protein LptD [Celerinatantimonas sp. YJH-8]|uniref:LPS assembly protein LptD n=1 Tax=Celerinatantimonas sp. YJH-8 TaxID=3228714 RepID=UPI0038C9B54E